MLLRHQLECPALPPQQPLCLPLLLGPVQGGQLLGQLDDL
jgi:hypothetical protein